MIDESAMRVRFAALEPVLDERGRRRFAAAGALAAGRGGVQAAACATGIARSTIGRGLAGLRSGEKIDAARVRRPGGDGREPCGGCARTGRSPGARRSGIAAALDLLEHMLKHGETVARQGRRHWSERGFSRIKRHLAIRAARRPIIASGESRLPFLNGFLPYRLACRAGAG